MLVTVGDVLPCHLEFTGFHKAVLDHILDFFYAGCSGKRSALFLNASLDVADLTGGKLLLFSYFIVGLLDSSNDLGSVKSNFLTASLNDLRKNPLIEIFSLSINVTTRTTISCGYILMIIHYIV